ncbi:HD-GYP domain-containing protein [Colwellia piezophila]|uniref:HD-GYP domain-containing protein n=1 Tax=Colwellia piezophila TaxID=211668 RepID=UPI00037A0D65|nr:HD domain-containing phosphohydrolase [Colwellia piezophila]
MKQSNTETVLVVDDLPENVNILTNILKADYRIKAAIDGESAIKIAKKDPPDLILLDIMMPRMDGYQVCKALKADPLTHNIPIIFVSARSEVEDETIGFECGAVDYITKPVNGSLVRKRVRAHINLYNQTRHLQSEVKLRTVELETSQLDLVNRLGRAAEFKDNETGMHVKRMSKYSAIIALEMGLNESDATLIEQASPMHDIGKIGIPDHILLKPGKFEADEWEIMKTHVDIGVQILKSGKSLLLDWACIIAQNHHEKWDGSGYPQSLKGEAIPLIGRIVAIADVFDALTSIRPYKKAWLIDDAVEFIKRESGKHFDPNVVDAFIRSLAKILIVKDRYQESHLL